MRDTSRPVKPEVLRVTVCRGDISKARQKLDLGQRPIEESIAKTVAWAESNGCIRLNLERLGKMLTSERW